ncbi:hypothetical protein [Streptomyces mirabilis]|uniref:hypothetical protein n=1 Tax=Streptomyces mirabilis TaxID=68239 RepID=UPI0036778451
MPTPSQSTFYRLVHQLADPAEHPHRPAHAFPAPTDRRAFTPTVALRPGEQVQVDTPPGRPRRFDDGTTGRPEPPPGPTHYTSPTLNSPNFSG